MIKNYMSQNSLSSYPKNIFFDKYYAWDTKLSYFQITMSKSEFCCYTTKNNRFSRIEEEALMFMCDSCVEIESYLRT